MLNPILISNAKLLQFSFEIISFVIFYYILFPASLLIQILKFVVYFYQQMGAASLFSNGNPSKWECWKGGNWLFQDLCSTGNKTGLQPVSSTVQQVPLLMGLLPWLSKQVFPWVLIVIVYIELTIHTSWYLYLPCVNCK